MLHGPTKVKIHHYSYEFLVFCHPVLRPGDHAVSSSTVLYQDLLFVLMSRWCTSCQLYARDKCIMFPGHVFPRIYTCHHRVENFLRSSILASKIKLSMLGMITVLILCVGVNQECTNPRRQVAGATKFWSMAPFMYDPPYEIAPCHLYGA
jgi:hypothetical protein